MFGQALYDDVRKGGSITKEQAEQILRKQIKFAEDDVKAVFGVISDPDVEAVLIDTAFNFGRPGLRRKTELVNAVERKDWETLAQELAKLKKGL